MAALKQTRTFRIPVFSGNILMVSAFEFQCFSLFFRFAVMVLLVCNGGKLNYGIRIQGNDLLDASKSF